MRVVCVMIFVWKGTDMRRAIDIKKSAENTPTSDLNKRKIMMLLLEVLLDIRDQMSKQNEIIRRNGRS